MLTRNFRSSLLAGAAFALMSTAHAEPLTPQAVTDDALDILEKSIGFRTVENSDAIDAYADFLAARLKAAGFADADIEVDKSGAAPTLVAIYRSGSDAPPLLLSGHMDVVEADPKDWERDPFTAVNENGYVFGRGAIDNKFGVAMMVATLVRLKGEGFTPKRDIVLALSGDEETSMVTTEKLADRFKGAALVLNSDGGGGTLTEDGAPVSYNLQSAEKTYADFEISFTNAGGHSSRPSKENAIYRLARALDRVADYDFPVQTSDTTLAFFEMTGATTPGPLGEAMIRFSQKPSDKKAIKTLRADPEYIGQLGTTCVATMLSGGHALNALPQRATASVNCRIFPGVSPESVRQTLLEVIDDPQAMITRLDETSSSDASPLRDDVMAAVRKSIDKRYPELPIVPQMSAGASDSLYFRANGVDSYGVSGLFMKPSDDYTHGLNERAPIAAIDGALDHWKTMITELSQ